MPSAALAFSGGLGREWLEVNAYGEPLSPNNPFEAHVAPGTDTMNLAKARSNGRLPSAAGFGPLSGALPPMASTRIANSLPPFPAQVSYSRRLMTRATGLSMAAASDSQ
jgi:hypothetical protein